MSDVRSEIEARGKPELGATEAVTELVITDEVEGGGDEVTRCHRDRPLRGVSASTGAQFDASWDRGAPISFPLDGVIQGWSQGLVGMKVGGRRTLVIPGHMAYGAHHRPVRASHRTRHSCSPSTWST